jgi:hypothetical protein
LIDPIEADPGGFDVLATRAAPTVRVATEGRAADTVRAVVVVGLVAAAVGFLAASDDTEALGRAAGALAEATEPVGEVTVERDLVASAVVGFPLTEDDRGRRAAAAGASGFAAGATDARRAGGAGAPAGRVAVVGLVAVAVAVGAALVDFLNAVAAAAAGFAPTAPPDAALLTAGAVLMAPAPKVPELTI